MRQNTYHPQTAKFIATVCQNMPALSGEAMQDWIEHPMDLQRVLTNALRSMETSPTTFPVFRTITLGRYKKVEDLREVFERQKVRVSDSASDLMNQPGFTLAPEKTDVNLVVLSVKDLGFPERATLQEIYARAQELGLHLCPAEVGPALRYQYPDQPADEWLTIAMELVADSDGDPSVFGVDHVFDVRWLRAHWGPPDHFWLPDHRFVFAGS